MIVRRTIPLPRPAARVWQAMQQWSTFVYVTRGLMNFRTDERPPEQFTVGQTCRGRLWLGHVVPAWRHELRVIEVDAVKGEIRTRESGGPLRVWNHTLRVETETTASCLYTDEIELDAGWLTGPAWVVAHGFFAYRQARWRRLARKLD